MGVLFGRAHGQRLTQMTSEICGRSPNIRRNLFSPQDKSLEKELIRAENHEVTTGTMTETQSLMAPVSGSSSATAAAAAGFSTHGDGALISSA